jgi:hypothetical protein
MAVVVSFDGTNITQAETGDDALWFDRGGGTGSAQNDDVVYEGSQSRGRKVDNTTLGFGYDAVTGINLSGLGDHLGFWFNITTANQLDTTANGGIRIRLGNGQDPDTTPFEEWYVSGSDSYPVVGGWSRIWFDVDQGSPDVGSGLITTEIRNFGGNFTVGNIAGNVSNCFIDRIDYILGTSNGGLTISGGHSGAEATFQDFVDFDEGTSTNRMGIATQAAGLIFINARLTIGTTAGCTFNDDSGSVIVFSPQEHAEQGFLGIDCIADRAANNIDWRDLTFRNAGTKTADITITGSSGGDFDAIDCVFDGLGDITSTAIATFRRCTFRNCGEIVVNETLCNFAASTGCTFSSTTGSYVFDHNPVSQNLIDKLANCTFQSNAIALRLTATGTPITLTFSNMIFTLNTTDIEWAGDDVLTILMSNGTNINEAKITTTGGGSVVVKTIVTVRVTAKDGSDLSVIENARVQLEAGATGDLPYEDSVTIVQSGGTATVTHTAHGMFNNDVVVIRGANEDEYNGNHTITNVSTNSYDYTVDTGASSPATGSITATAVILSGLTSAQGIVEATEFNYTNDQDVIGYVRKSSSSPYYKNTQLTGTIADTGYDVVASMAPDE